MATDSLVIFDDSFTGVTGIKATDSNNNVLTYIRPQGTKSITANGTGIDVTNYASVDVSVSSQAPSLQAKTNITPTESSQTITADNGYDGLSSVQINAISSNYVGSGITRRDSTDIDAYAFNHNFYVDTPAGYYPNGTTYTVESAQFNEPTASYSGRTGSFTFSKPILTAGYTDMNVGAVFYPEEIADLDLRSSSDLTASGATVTVPNGFYEIAATKTIASGTEGTPTATKGTVSNHAISVTPSVTNTAGYISGGTKTGTAVTVSASELVSGTYTVDSSGTKDVTNYASASVPALTLPTAASSTSSGTSKATISRSTSAQYINIPTGFNDTAQYYTISATPNGTVTAPSSISGTSASISTGSGTLTLTKTVSVTPNVSTAGYISAGTAGNSSVSLTANVTIKGTATITPTTTSQTIAANTYISGAQTIAGDANLVGSNIISGKSIFGVAGTVTFQTIYSGSSAPSSSTGANGDIYIRTG